MADQDPTLAQNDLAQNDDAATPQDQFKPAQSQFGQNHPTQGATDIQGASGQQGQGQATEEAGMTGSAAAGYGQTGFTGDMGGSGQVAGNDQAGGGLGQNHSGYGGDNDPTSTEPGAATHDAQQQASQGIGTRSDNLGPAPGGGQQPRSATTGGPDLSKGLADGNRGGGSF